MKSFIFGERNGVHIINLEQTVPMLHHAMETVRDTVKNGGRILFVGTKRQAQSKIAEAAAKCGQYYVNHRWLGGMLTNWKTISQSIKRLRQLEEILSEGTGGRTKKELLQLNRERDRLDRALGGIKDMAGQPDLIFIIDTNKESIAIQEATNLKIPVVAVIDTNSNPDGVTFPIPGNDDALRAIDLYCDLIAGAVLEGIQAEMAASGVDIGAMSETPPEDLTPTAELEADPALAEASASEVETPAEAETASAQPEEASAEVEPKPEPAA